ncbi:MAG TPA: hypothetical protein VGK80_11340 [Rhodanobacteraceae bacterium]
MVRIKPLLVVFALLLAPTAQAAQILLAPIYPGAVADQTARDERYAFFFTRDPIEKVRAWYQTHGFKLGDGSDSRSPGYGLCGRTVPLDTVNKCYSKVLLGQSATAHYLKDMTDAYSAGLVIQAKEREPERAPEKPQSTGNAELDKMMAAQAAAEAQMQAQADGMAAELGMKPGELEAMNKMSDLFEGLKDGTLPPYNHPRSDLIRIAKQYQYLDTAEYPQSPDGKQGYDRWLLAKDKAAFAGAGDHWSQWLGFLKDLDAHAYRTRIIIAVDPKSWGRKL